MENEVNENSQPKHKDSVPTQMGDVFQNPRNPQHLLTAPNNINASSSSALVEATPINGCNDNATINTTLEFFDSLPPGYRFCPFDDELIVYYLKKKVMNEVLPPNKIVEVNLYKHHPMQLAEKYKLYGEKELYFFTPRDRKYRNGSRPGRGAENGYWKATGADKPIKFKSNTVGFRKALVFYEGDPPKGTKTNWIMHEYRANIPPRIRKNADDMRLDDWVLCRVYKKADKSTTTQPAGELSPSTQDEGEEEVVEPKLEEVVEPKWDEVVEPKFDSDLVIHDSQAYIPLPPIQNGLADIPQISYQSQYPITFHKMEGPIQALFNKNYEAQLPRMAKPVGVMTPLMPPPMDQRIFSSKYIQQESMASKQEGFQEDYYGSVTNLKNYYIQSQDLYYGNQADSYLDLDNNLANPTDNPIYPTY